MIGLCSRLGNIFRNVVKAKQVDVCTEESKPEPIKLSIREPEYTYAHGSKFKNNPTWIVVHYTACINVGAKGMCRAMRKNESASSHFYVDENDICSAVPLEYIAWHVGDGKCKQPNAYEKKSLEELANFKCNDWRYDLAAKSHLKWQSEGNDFLGNKCSIGVDICVKKKSSNGKNKATDTDWYFEDAAVDNTAKLVAYLASKYSIDDSHIITHCMATGKLCPQPFVWPPEKGDAEWEKFKAKVVEYMERCVIVK